MNDYNRKKRKLKPIILLIVAVLILALASACYFVSNKYTGKEYIKYNETSALDYIVCYRQPNDIGQGCLSQTINNYITKYIDEIKLNFNYKLAISKAVTTTYKYKIIGEITIYDRNNHLLVMDRKPYDLTEEKEVIKSNIDEIIISDLFELKYKEYEDYFTNYRNNASVSAAANLKVTLHIESSNKHNNVSDSIPINTDISIDIPLGEPTIQLNTNYTPSYISPDIKIDTNQAFMNIILKALSAMLGILGFIFVVSSIVANYNKQKSIPIYNKLVNELKNDFDYEISELASLIDSDDEDNYEYFDVVSFKELYDFIKTSTDKKILCNEKKYYNKRGKLENRISWFFVFMSDNKVMRFIVDESKVKEEYVLDKNIFKKYRG